MSENKEQHTDLEGLVARYIETKRDDLRDIVMVQCAGMVERIARRFSGVEAFEDLVQVGYIGLLNALGKFDPNAGVRFNTYATYLIAGEMKHYLRDRSQTIRQPAWLQELRHRVSKSASSLQCQLGRIPTEREIADDLGISEAAVVEVLQTQEMLKVTSLDATPQNDQEGDSDVDKLDAAAYCPEQLSFEDRLLLESAMRQLRDLEREVLVLFHFESLNQTEIANKLGISCNYVSHILRQSLAKMRKILSKEAENDRALRRESEEMDHDVLDSLTGAYTEGFFKSRLEEEIHRASSNNSAVGVVTISFTGLESLSRFYGAQAYEEFMIDAADFCRESVRRLDLVCHNGEAGFSIILPGTGEHVPLIRDRLLSKLGRWMSKWSPQSLVSAEVKHGSFPMQGTTSRDLMASLQVVKIENQKVA